MMPPELAGLLQGGPPPQDPGPDPSQGGGERDAIGIVKQMQDLAKQYLEVEPDVEEKSAMAQLLAKLHQILAKDQQDTNKVLGNPSALAKVVGRFGQQ